MKVIRAIFCILCFLGAFRLACGGLEKLLPPVQVPIVTPKLDWMAEHGDDYDVLLLGSSRTFRQIIPEIFDAEMAAAGHPVRTFNLGVDGMRPPEDTFLLEKVLASRTKKLQLVLVECNTIRLTERDEDRGTQRMAYWHDWKRMVTLFQRAFFAESHKRSWASKLQRMSDTVPALSEHAGYWMWNFSNLGRGHELLSELLRPLPLAPASVRAQQTWLQGFGDWFAELFRVRPFKTVSKADLGRRKDGYMPGASLTPQRKVDYEAKFARQLLKPIREDDYDRVSQEELRVKKRMIEAAGGRMVLVVPPFLGELYFTPFKNDPTMPPVLVYARPEDHPELFTIEHRADDGHVNPAGAEVYTRLIVRELLPLLQRTSSSP